MRRCWKDSTPMLVYRAMGGGVMSSSGSTPCIAAIDFYLVLFICHQSQMLVLVLVLYLSSYHHLKLHAKG